VKTYVFLKYESATCDFYVQLRITLFSLSMVLVLAESPGLSHNDEPENSIIPYGSVSGVKYMKSIYQLIHPILKV
jgi:hypothetical protein